MIHKILISAVPFSTASQTPIDALRSTGAALTVNPYGRTLSESEMFALVPGHTVIVAGTEPITADVMDQAPQLRLISRVGIGLDSVDLDAAKARGIAVSYTPDEPAPAVAELTIGLMIDVLRFVSVRNISFRRGEWDRPLGRRLANVTVGLVGMGRIGRRVARHLSAFGTRILASDLSPDDTFGRDMNLTWVDNHTLCKDADIVSLHVPLTDDTRCMINGDVISSMKRGSALINTSRGNIVDEVALHRALKSGHLSGAAMDVFSVEPYAGPLTELDNCVLTCHLGSCTDDCHTAMELRAAEEAARFIAGVQLTGLVPGELYGELSEDA